MMDKFDIYMTGVGGQGIGLLSEILIRAADYAGLPVSGVDTHGLAQRGGVVQSHLRIGKNAASPLVKKHNADLVVALERHEAVRSMNTYCKKGGTVVYYDAVWQPLPERMNHETEIKIEEVTKAAGVREVKLHKVYDPGLLDARFQNMLIISYLAKEKIIPGVVQEHYEKAIHDLLGGAVLEKNLELFAKYSA